MLPLHRYAGLSGRLLTDIFTATRFPGAQRRAVRKRLGKRLRHAWPHPLVLVRGDSHGAAPEVLQGLAAHADRSAVTGLTSNAVVKELAREVVYRHLDCARGQRENESKDPTRSLKSDRTSCHRFGANQCRLLLHSAAYVLLDTRRREV